jgi:hypothetical protein
MREKEPATSAFALVIGASSLVIHSRAESTATQGHRQAGLFEEITMR